MKHSLYTSLYRPLLLLFAFFHFIAPSWAQVQFPEPGLKEETYTNNTFTGTPALAVVPNLDVIWPSSVGEASRRYSGLITPQFSETYTFSLNVNDRAKVWVNNQLILDVGTETDNVADYWLVAGTTIALQAGVAVPFKVEYANAVCSCTRRHLYSYVSYWQDLCECEFC